MISLPNEKKGGQAMTQMQEETLVEYTLDLGRQMMECGAEAWRAGDLRRYGELVFASGRSSVENYECGSPELIALYQIMTETQGIYGGRFSGAGFKGCCMALADPDRTEEITREVTKKYLKQFPALEGRFSVHFCRSANGVII